MADRHNPNLDERTACLLKTICDQFYNEDRATRERQLRKWKKLKLYWNGLNQIYYDSVAHDYRTWGADSLNSDSNQDYYDRPVNVFKALLETIIAALSIQIPAVSCIPDDAENPSDLLTAKTGDKISELIYKHNDVIFLWLYALYVYCTEGMIACYTYIDEDEKYGTYEEKTYKDEEIETYICPNCEEQFDDFDLSEEIEGEESQPICPECSEVLAGDGLVKQTLKVPKFVGKTRKAKSRVCLEVYGGMYVKVAGYAKKQEDTPYLIWMYETNYVNVLEEYPELRDVLPKGGNGVSSETYEQYARLNPEFREEYPMDNVTVKNNWLRPCSYNILNEDDEEFIRKQFPIGVRVNVVNDTVAHYCVAELDKNWTLTRNPLSDYLVHAPLGEFLVNIQDIINDLISLTLQTIEHGIVTTWAKPDVVDFNKFGQLEAAPGTIIAAKPQPENARLSDGFHETKQASLSPEVFNFYRIVEELGQFVSGALPSLFGGQLNSGSSRTASEYNTSRSMALQRLQTPWKMLTIWWKQVFGKAIPLFIETVRDDQRYVEKDKNGNFINTWIRRTELQGKIGDVELEASEQLPISDEQKRQTVMELMQLNNAEIIGALISPSNLPFIRKVVRLPEMVLPGEEDRQAELEIIQQLITEEPDQLVNPLTGAEEEQTTIPIDPILDNPQICAEVDRNWLKSEAGRLAKIENPAGYKNVLLRLQQFTILIQQQMMQQAMINQTSEEETASGNQPPAKKQNSSSNTGEEMTGVENG